MLLKYQRLSLLLLGVVLLHLGCCQLAPQISVTNPVLGTVTSYKLNYLSTNNLTTSTTFTVSFGQSYLKIPDGINNCTIRVSGTTVLSPYCQCSNRTCTFKPMINSDPKVVDIEIQNVTNPLFTFAQTVNVFIYFTPTISYNYSVVIPISTYQPMSMIVNSLTQSDYGVGYTPVTYTFNISLYYIAKNMQMQITIPSQVTFSSISSSLSFYSTIQNMSPYQVQSLLVFYLQVDAISNPSGFMLLTLSGLGNPRYLGNSTSFKITFVDTTTVSGCTTCRIAQLSNGLAIQSRNPGDVIAISITSSNSYISSITNITINLQLYAGIPSGGKVSIYLPPQIKPVDPIQCDDIYGFIFPDNTSPVCVYNSSVNRVDTVNFVTPIFDSTGNGIMSLNVINPQNSKQVSFKFQTYDSSGRMIGQSRANSYYSAVPLPLNITINKTAQEVDKIFNLSCQILLSKSLNVSNNFLQVILPAVTYDLSQIRCYSAGQDLNCTKTLDAQKQLNINFAPPCVQCTANSTLKFTITSLKNPSYINDMNQQIIVNTRSSQGLIESAQKSIKLNPSPITLVTYSKPMNQVVGTQYNLTMQLNIPDYVKVNGGQIHILFSNISTYTDGQVSGLYYSGPTYSLQIVTNTSSSLLSNTVQYNTDIVPDSISKIIFNICDGTISKCGLNDTNFVFIIRKLKVGYMPAQQLTDTLRISTQFGQIIAQKIMDTSSYAPILINGGLTISATRAMTNTFSDFVFTFTSSQVVIDKTITLILPTALTINGQCSITSNQGVVINYVCSKASPNSITINHDYDQNLMIMQTITYSISITNVSTPVSTAPQNYILQTNYNGVKNQRFSARYSMQSAYPLSVTYSKTNYTINQQFKLSLTIAPVTVKYDSWQLVLNKNSVTLQQDWVPSFSLTQNSTHYILDRSGLMTNNYTQIRGKNSLSTYDQPQYVLNLLQTGYLVQQSSITPINNVPVVLGCQISVSNRTVDTYTNMSITCDRNSNGQLNQQNIVIKLSTNGFDYSSAKIGNTSISASSPIVRLPITVLSGRVITATITQVRNIRYIPNINASLAYVSNSIQGIDISTIGNSSQKIIGKALLTPDLFITNDAYDVSNITGTRTGTKSAQYANITINYTTVLGSSQHMMQILLPAGQNTYSSASTCVIDTTTPCNVINYTSTDIRIMVPNKTITLTKLLNSYPNTNMLAIKIYTYPEAQLVQEAYTAVTPPIALQKINITGTATSAEVADINIVTLQLKPVLLKIQSTNIIVISIPSSTFTRAFNTDDCIVRTTTTTNTFTGCTYGYDTGAWLTTIKLGSIGPFDIDTSNSITVTFTVTNAWTTYPFNNKTIKVTVLRNQTTALSQGVCTLVDIYPTLSTFSLIPIIQSKSSFSQSVLAANTANSLSLNISIAGNIGKGSKIVCMLPKDSYIFSTQSQISRQDASYYYIEIVSVCVSAGCINYSQLVSISVLNSKYVKKQRNSVIVYVSYDGLAVSQSYTVVPQYHIAQSIPDLQLSRSSNMGAQPTNITIMFSLSDSNIADNGQITIDISNNMTNNRLNSTYSYYQYNSSTSVYGRSSSTVIARTSINISINVSQSSISKRMISMLSTNPLQVPIQAQRYYMVVHNSTHILYATQSMQFPHRLQPISTGVNPTRNSALVASNTSITIMGTVPIYQYQLHMYKLYINEIVYANMVSNIIEVAYGAYTNPMAIENEPTLSISICNRSHCIYRQTQASIVPALVPISASDISISVPTTMTISTNYNLVVNFSKPITNKRIIKIQTSNRLYNSIVSVIGYYADGTKIEKITDIVTTTNTDTYIKVLSIRRVTDRLLNISSIQIQYTSPQYQTYLNNTQMKVSHELPTTVHTSTYNISILGRQLNATLTCTTNKTQEIANFSLYTQVLARTGIMSIVLPKYISDLYSQNSVLNLHQRITLKIDNQRLNITGVNIDNVCVSPCAINNTNNSNILNSIHILQYNSSRYILNMYVNGTNRNISLLISSVLTPIDNRPLAFILNQHQLQTQINNIYGYKQLSVKMTQLGLVHVHEGVRNITKIGAYIQLKLDIQTSTSTTDKMIITLSPTQVLVLSNSTCTIVVDGVLSSVTVVPQSTTNSVILSSYVTGRHTYTISTCIINSLFSQQPKQGDQIYVGIAVPYQIAESKPSTSTYITPLISTGTIEMLSSTSTSNKRVQYTTVTYHIKPQNWNSIDGVYIVYHPLTYYIHKNIAAYVNSRAANKYVVNQSTIYIQTKSITQATIQIKLMNMINYIQYNTYTIYTLKKKNNNDTTSTAASVRATDMPYFNISQYGYSDQITVPASNTVFSALNAQTRIIFPDNYASGAVKTIMAINDYKLPKQLPLSTLSYTFNSSQTNCGSANVQFSATIQIQCVINKQGITTFTLSLFDTKVSATPLTTYTQSIYIYPAPKQHCNNVLCDVCSDRSGQQYCFSCREGLFSSNGQCVPDCPAQTFPYQQHTCTQCAPSCNQCFDLFDNSCLSCTDHTLVLDSGTCRGSCSAGYAYQAKYCVDTQECTGQSGCRVCSPTGFCYQCLPDYDGQPICKFAQLLPKNFFIFFMIPFLLLLPIVLTVTCCKVGASTLSHMIIYLLAVIQLFSWVFIIPKMPQQSLAMVMCAFVLLKIIISIISYQTYYIKQIQSGKQQKLLGEHQSEEKTDHLDTQSKKSKQKAKNQQSVQECITHKQRLTRFSAHFINCDAYQLLMNKLGKPFINVTHYFPYFITSILNRLIVMVFLVYIITKASNGGDLLYIPLISIISGVMILLIRASNSEKFQACWARIRG